MAQLRVRDLRKDSRETEKEIRKYFILKSSCNFEKPAALNWKRFANRALLTITATLLNDTDVKHFGNYTDTITIYLRERSRERSPLVYLYHTKCGSDDDLCQSFPFL